MIELTIQIDDIDYDSAAEILLPVFTDQFVNGSDNPMLKKLFSGSQSLSVSAAKSFISALPQKKKDEIISKYLNHKKKEITAGFIDYAEKNHVKLKVTKFEASAK